MKSHILRHIIWGKRRGAIWRASGGGGAPLTEINVGHLVWRRHKAHLSFPLVFASARSFSARHLSVGILLLWRQPLPWLRFIGFTPFVGFIFGVLFFLRGGHTRRQRFTTAATMTRDKREEFRGLAAARRQCGRGGKSLAPNIEYLIVRSMTMTWGPRLSKAFPGLVWLPGADPDSCVGVMP